MCIVYVCFQFADCGNPPTPANGAVTLTNYGETTPGATATQMCDIGYTLSGTADIYCGTDGLWSDHPVTCSLIGMYRINVGFICACICTVYVST